MADELNHLISSISELDRVEMIRALERANDRSEKAMRAARSRKDRLRRGHQKEMAALQHSEAVLRMERIGRILFFLRHGIDADGATLADRELCTELQSRLMKKGQW